MASLSELQACYLIRIGIIHLTNHAGIPILLVDGGAMNLNAISSLDENQAREYLETVRWPNGATCPHCGEHENIRKLDGSSHRPGLYQCNPCRRQFSVMIGTIFERSHIPLRIWLMAFAIMCASKKGVSALQLQRQLGLGSYQTAWHMAHRIRHAMKSESLL